MTPEEQAAADAAAEAARKAAEPNADTDTDKPATLTEEEVNKRIEAARKQEKDKLYGKIGDLEKVVTELNSKHQAEKEAKEKAEAEAKAKADAKRQADMSQEDRTAEALRRIEEQLANEHAERTRLERELHEEREQAKLEQYRQQLIRDAGEEVIPDLIRGNTMADVEKSVAYAKSKYQELFSVSRKRAEKATKDNMPGPTNPNPAALDEAELQQSLSQIQIDPKRYLKDSKYKAEMDEKRNALLDRVGQAYQRSVRG